VRRAAQPSSAILTAAAPTTVLESRTEQGLQPDNLVSTGGAGLFYCFAIN